MSSSDYTVYWTMAEGRKSKDLLLAAAELLTGQPAAYFTVDRAAQGKPYFCSHPDLHFSISHSGEIWACAFGSAEVGLDVQQQVNCDCRRLVERFFHQDEAAALAVTGWLKTDFFELWAAKESYIKYTGRGITAGLAYFSLCPPPESPQFWPLDFIAGYSMCLCAENISRVFLYRF